MVSETQLNALVVADFVLIGCVGSKRNTPAAARDLFVSPLFERRRRYAESTGRPWYILSAEHGLVHPDMRLEPYDLELDGQSGEYRRVWGEWVAVRLTHRERSLRGRVIEVHAADSYIDTIRAPLARAGATIRHPLRGLTFRQQFAWYGAVAGAAASPSPPRQGELLPAPANKPASKPASTATADLRPAGEQPAGMAPSVNGSAARKRRARHRGGSDIFEGPRETQPFDFEWPDAVEHFTRGWELEIRVEGRVRRVRHALGVRDVYGRQRVHSLTFLDGQPIIEGFASDDYDDSRCLVSALEGIGGQLVRVPEDVPPAYVGLPLVNHRAEINVTYAMDAVAVKLAEDDAVGWAAFVLAREEVLAGERGEQVPVPTPPLPVGRRAGTREDVIAALSDYSQQQDGADTWVEPSFTPLAAANRLIVDNPFAFLVGVVFDGGIDAVRAWRAPYDLKQRLGHLDPARIVSEEHAVRAAIGQPPKLHANVDRVFRWVVAAANRIVDEHGGDAGEIWGDRPTVRELRHRLARFLGVGDEKADMAVAMLVADLSVPVREIDTLVIAHDVHVRRVFLRTRLAETDDLDHMRGVAQAAGHQGPEGAMDVAAWRVGRQWCHAGVPDCPGCVLREVCPKDIANRSWT